MDSATNFLRDGNELAQQAVVVGLIPTASSSDLPIPIARPGNWSEGDTQFREYEFYDCKYDRKRKWGEGNYYPH